ncbi:MAG: acylphosphatase [Dehalococcoidia bacterium]
MPELASLSAKVYGFVQGVFFRSFVKEHARKLGLNGYAKNLPDGRTVEVRAEGERDNLEKLVDQLRVGPPGARVENVDVEWGEYAGDFNDFKTR